MKLEGRFKWIKKACLDKGVTLKTFAKRMGIKEYKSFIFIVNEFVNPPKDFEAKARKIVERL